MNLRNFISGVAITFVVMSLTNCQIKKQVYPNANCVEDRINQIDNCNPSQTTIKRTQVIESQKAILNLNENNISNEASQITSSQNSALPNVTCAIEGRQIKELNVLYIDGTDFIEKREMKKCYENLNTFEDNDTVYEETGLVKVASFIMPALIPTVFVAALMAFAQIKDKSNSRV